MHSADALVEMEDRHYGKQLSTELDGSFALLMTIQSSYQTNEKDRDQAVTYIYLMPYQCDSLQS